MNYFDSVNTMMLTGTIINRQLIQNKILSQDDIVEARILRSPALIKVFGLGNSDQSPKDVFEQQGLAGTKAFKQFTQGDKRMMSFILPIRASADDRGTNCLTCHQVNENEILGAVKLHMIYLVWIKTLLTQSFKSLYGSYLLP